MISADQAQIAAIGLALLLFVSVGWRVVGVGMRQQGASAERGDWEAFGAGLALTVFSLMGSDLAAEQVVALVALAPVVGGAVGITLRLLWGTASELIPSVTGWRPTWVTVFSLLGAAVCLWQLLR